MTLQECKDQIAKKYGYRNWIDLFLRLSSKNSVIQYYEEAAELYANSQYNQAIDDVIEKSKYLSGAVTPDGKHEIRKFQLNEILILKK